jgi:uncharacterized oxidoreductase
MRRIPAAQLAEFTTQLLVAARVPRSDAEVVARSLVDANLRGYDSHGVMRVPQYVGFLERGQYRPGVGLRIERETPALVVCDAQSGLGQVQAHRLLDLVIPKAHSLGVAVGAAHHCGHVGRLGEFGERATEDGLVLIGMANINGGGQWVAPPGATEPRLSTNPLCIAVPTTDLKMPVVIDFGTSAAAEGKVRECYIGDRPVPDGWLLDHEGMPTKNPAVLYEPPLGTILPFGGGQSHKGFGLGLGLELMAGGLSGGRCVHPDGLPARFNNVLFIALDPELFAGRDRVASQATEVAEYIRATPRRAGVDAVRVPGDCAHRTLRHRMSEGIPLDENHWLKLAELAGRLGVEVPATAIPATPAS